MAPDTNERQPLLVRDAESSLARRRSNRWHWPAAAGLLIAAALLLTLLIVPTVQRSQELIQQSVEVDLTRMQISRLTSSGLKLQVEAAALVDYDLIDNNFSAQVFKAGGLLFQTALIRPEPLEVTVMFDDEEIALGTIQLPPMNVGIRNKIRTVMNMSVDLVPHTRSLLFLMKRILDNPKDLLKLHGTGSVVVTLGLVPLGSFGINFDQLVRPSLYFQGMNFDELVLDDLIVAKNGPGFDINGHISLPNPIRNKVLGFQVPELSLGLLVQDCYGEATVPLFSKCVTCGPFQLSPTTETLSVNFSTEITELNSLLQDCADGTTPLKKIIKQLMNNETVPLTVGDLKIPSSTSMFLNKLLGLMDLQFNYQPRGSINQYLKSVNLDNVQFQLDNTGELQVFMSADVNLYVKTPMKEATVDRVRGKPRLYHQNQQFGVINMMEWHSCTNEWDEILYVHLKLDHEEVDITDSSVFSSLINEMFLKGSATVQVEAELDAVLNLEIAQFQVDDIRVSTETKITKGFL